MTRVLDRLRQVWCRLLGGHLPVTRRGAGRVQERCYLCDAPLGAGWDVRDLAPPPGLPPVRVSRATKSWLRPRRRTA